MIRIFLLMFKLASLFTINQASEAAANDSRFMPSANDQQLVEDEEALEEAIKTLVLGYTEPDAAEPQGIINLMFGYESPKADKEFAIAVKKNDWIFKPAMIRSKLTEVIA